MNPRDEIERKAREYANEKSLLGQEGQWIDLVVTHGWNAALDKLESDVKQKIWPAQDHSDYITGWNVGVQKALELLRVLRIPEAR